jgi:hypothetical protein
VNGLQSVCLARQAKALTHPDVHVSKSRYFDPLHTCSSRALSPHKE